jgi:hypothetical protein
MEQSSKLDDLTESPNATEATHVKQSLMSTVHNCEKCSEPLTGDFIRALNRTFHIKCFTCAVSLFFSQAGLAFPPPPAPRSVVLPV